MFVKSVSPILIALIITTGCGSDSVDGTTIGTPATTDLEISNSGSSSNLQLAPPLKIRESLAVDFNQLRGTINVNGQAFEMTRRENDFIAVLENVPVNSNVQIDLQFIEDLSSGQQLPLARTNQITIDVAESDLMRQILQSEYEFDFDADSDGVSNFAERNNNTDPFTAEAVTSRNVAVEFDLPAMIENPNITQVIALITDIPRVISRSGNQIAANGLVPSNIPIDIEIRLTQQFNNQQVFIATASDVVAAGPDDFTVLLDDDDFDFSLDSDGDGVPNLIELQNGGNPFP